MAIVIAGVVLILVSKELIVFNAETLVLICFASFVGRVAIRGRDGVVGHFEEQRKQIEKDTEAQREKLIASLRASRSALTHLTERGSYIAGYVEYYYTARECRKGKAAQTLSNRVVQHVQEQLKRRQTVETNAFEQRQKARATTVPEQAVQLLAPGPELWEKSFSAALGLLDERGTSEADSEGAPEGSKEAWFEKAKEEALRYYETREEWTEEEWAADEWEDAEWNDAEWNDADDALRSASDELEEEGEDADAYTYADDEEEDLSRSNEEDSANYDASGAYTGFGDDLAFDADLFDDAFSDSAAIANAEALFQAEVAASTAAYKAQLEQNPSEVELCALRHSLGLLQEQAWDEDAWEEFFIEQIATDATSSDDWSVDTEYVGDLFEFKR